MGEFFDILDEQGNKTGKIKKREDVHRDGDWHKSVHIWIVNDKNEVLLQKRSPNKDSHPNMWDISCAGHLIASDTSISGALREAKEELGLDLCSSQLQLIGQRKKASCYTQAFINNEFSDVYLLRLSIDIHELQLQTEEVSEVKFVSLDTFKNMIRAKDKTLLMHNEEFEMLFFFFLMVL